jgi:hypothetical protein
MLLFYFCSVKTTHTPAEMINWKYYLLLIYFFATIMMRRTQIEYQLGMK